MVVSYTESPRDLRVICEQKLVKMAFHQELVGKIVMLCLHRRVIELRPLRASASGKFRLVATVSPPACDPWFAFVTFGVYMGLAPLW